MVTMLWSTGKSRIIQYVTYLDPAVLKDRDPDFPVRLGVLHLLPGLEEAWDWVKTSGSEAKRPITR
jgi:hypothetical protein